MKKMVGVFSLLALLAVPSIWAKDVFVIKRLKIILNPFPGDIPTREVMEVIFEIRPSGWVKDVGLCALSYDEKKQPGTVMETFYFSRREVPAHRIQRRNFKGEGTFTAYFPLPGPTAYTVVALGNARAFAVERFPSDALIEEFDLSPEEVRKGLALSEYRVLTAEPKY